MVENLSIEQLAAFKNTFLTYDEDGSGCVGIMEMVNQMKPLGIEVSKTKLLDMMTLMDVEHHKEISFPDFVNLMGGTIKDDDIETELELAFKEITRSKDNPITKLTFRRIFAQLNEQVNEEELRRVMECFDLDPETPDEVDYEEFFRGMLK